MPYSQKVSKLLQELNSYPSGLSKTEALSRKAFKRKDHSEIKEVFLLFFRNFSSPLVILLLVAAFFSVYLGDKINSSIIFIIVIVSGLISFIQELKAAHDTRSLIQSMKMQHMVLRDNEKQLVFADDLVVGDILLFDAGDLVPLDCELVESTDVFANESSLTGESIPKEKHLEGDSRLKMGSYIVSGIAKAVVLPQGKNNSYSELMSYISRTVNVSSFTESLREFSKFLMKVTLVFTSAILLILILFKTTPLQGFLFALSIAVGLSPQLLPAVLTTNLAIGASRMAKAGAITKRLEVIESFGNMDLLCCDKTGTLTKGKIEMYAALDPEGIRSDEVRRLGYINALLQTGFQNTLDQAIITANHFDHTLFEKIDEIPYDFNRKILSIFANVDKSPILIAKGALESILERCQITKAEKDVILDRAKTYYLQGFRLLGLAAKPLEKKLLSKSDENQMIFKGFLLFFDPIKDDCRELIQHIKDLGIRLVMITGDHPVIASFVAKESGFNRQACFDANDLNDHDFQALDRDLENYDVFARVGPMYKARIIESFKNKGYVVGYLGDGINDSGALFASDVGISVESGSDIAKATADIILVKKQLSILIQGVKEGRKIFGNTIKYILLALSANFGNMFSMAAVALFIPYLPLLPTQILLINLLQDVPMMSISADHVDHDIIQKPQKWSIKFIKRFMIVFGPISSFFDFSTFVMLKLFEATPEQFRTAWFTESVLSATLIILFARTKLPFFKSKPSWILTGFVFSIITLTLLIPYTSLGSLFAIISLPTKFYVAIGVIVLMYATTVEIAKRIFYKWISKHSMTSS